MVGIVTIDDIIDLIAEQLTSLVGTVQREQHREHPARAVWRRLMGSPLIYDAFSH